VKIADGIYWVGSGAVGLSEPGDCHTYVVEGKHSMAMIDCGMSPVPGSIIRNMLSDGLDPARLRYLLLTHAHPDHAGGCSYLKKEFGTEIICSGYEGRVLEMGPACFFNLPAEQEGLEQWYNMPVCVPDGIIEDNDIVDLGGIEIKAVLTPGHSPGSTCYLACIGGSNMLFSGDTVFYKGFISVLSPPFSDLTAYRQNLKKLADRGVEGLFPGHLMWVLKGGQKFIDMAVQSFEEYRLPTIKPFS